MKTQKRLSIAFLHFRNVHLCKLKFIPLAGHKTERGFYVCFLKKYISLLTYFFSFAIFLGRKGRTFVVCEQH